MNVVHPRINRWQSTTTRLFTRAPEVLLTWVAWLVVIVAAWIRYPLGGAPYALDTIAYVVFVILCGSFPMMLVKSRFSNEEEANVNGGWLGMNRPTLFTLSALSFGISALIYVYRYQQIMGPDRGLDEYRVLKSQVGSEGGGRLMQLNYFFMAFGMISCYLVSRIKISKAKATCFTAYILTIFTVVYLKIGTRAEFLPPVVVLFTGFIVFKTKLIAKNALKVLPIFASVLIALVLLNSILSAVGARGGFFGASSTYMGDRGALMFDGLGIKNAPDELSTMLGFLDEYIISPIYYYDHYYQNINHEPAYGALQFDVLARRIGIEDRYIIKLEIDEEYSSLNIGWNVWATAIREIGIDAGKYGAALVFATLGIAGAIGKKFASQSLGAGFIFVIIASFMILSPSTSIFRSRYSQFALYVGILWVVSDFLHSSRTGRQVRTNHQFGVQPAALKSALQKRLQ